LITVVGAVASLGDELAWQAAARPLAGKSVVVNRTRAQASQLRIALEVLVANVLETPVLEIRFGAPDLVKDERVGSRWDWIVFSSQNGADAFFGALRAAGWDARSLGTTRVAAIGAATAGAVERHGVVPDFVPSVANGETLAAELPRASGARILLPAGSLSEERLADALRVRGGHIEQVQVYQTLPVSLSAEHVSGVLAADAITFASASSATFLRLALGEADLPEAVRLCAIGERAGASVEAAFGRVDAVAKEPSIEALAAAVVEALT
jgi:uroporphyrinogen III methyltransferase/synthase